MTVHIGKMQPPKAQDEKGEGIVCTPRNRGIYLIEILIDFVIKLRREDRDELTSGLSAVPPGAPPSSYVGNG